MKLPDLKIGNRNRMLTKHFTNFCLVLDRDSLGLFAWLCYRADMSNKVPGKRAAKRGKRGCAWSLYRDWETKISEIGRAHV